MLAKGQKEIVSESTCDGIENQKMIKRKLAKDKNMINKEYWEDFKWCLIKMGWKLK